MMKAAVILAFVLACSVCSDAVSTNTTAQTIAAEPATAFVYNPTLNGAALPKAGSGGLSQRRTVTEWPALRGMGMSQSTFILEGCGVRTPHVHEKATGLIFVTNAENLMVGFVQESGVLVANNLTTGASSVFPQGLVHFEQNLACSPAEFVISYNDEEGATANTIPGLMNLPKRTVMASLGITEDVYTSLKSTAQTNNIYQDMTCVAACGTSYTPVSTATNAFAG